MSDNDRIVLVALIAAMPAIVGALATFWKIGSAAKATALLISDGQVAADVQRAAQTNKLDAIHTQVNGNSHADKARIAELEAEVAELKAKLTPKGEAPDKAIP